MTQWGNWKPLIKQWENCVGRLNDLMGKTGNWAIDGAMEHLGPFGDAMGKIETLAMGKLGPPGPDDLMGKLGGPRPRIISNGLIRHHCTKIHEAPITHFSFHISKVV